MARVGIEKKTSCTRGEFSTTEPPQTPSIPVFYLLLKPKPCFLKKNLKRSRKLGVNFNLHNEVIMELEAKRYYYMTSPREVTSLNINEVDVNKM